MIASRVLEERLENGSETGCFIHRSVPPSLSILDEHRGAVATFFPKRPTDIRCFVTAPGRPERRWSPAPDLLHLIRLLVSSSPWEGD
jgi:hypothetical protein